MGEGGEGARRWELLGRESVGDYEIFTVERLQARSPRNGKVFDRYMLDLPDWINMVALTDDGRVILVEQYRFAAEELSLEFLAGMVDEGEDPRDAAKRELEEETGYQAGEVELLTTLWPDPAILRNSVAILLARDCKRTGERELDEGEDVHVELLTPAEVEEAITSGRIRHSIALTAWMLASRRLEEDR